MSSAVYVRRNQNLYRPKSSLQLGPISVGFWTIATVSVLALLYLTQITKTNVYGYKVSELKTQRDRLVAAKQDLEIEAARLQSLQQIQASPTVAKLVTEQGAVYADSKN